MADTDSVFPKVESRFALTRDMTCDLITLYNNESFSKGSANLKMKCFFLESVIVEIVPTKEYLLNVQSIWACKTVKYLKKKTKFDIQENVKIDDKFIEKFQGTVFPK